MRNDGPVGPAANLALRAWDLGKSYELAPSRARRLVRLLRGAGRERASESTFWAVKDVSFTLAHGGSLGLIGRNGSGKSTLLRLLARTAHPSAGRVEVSARLGCLLDLGVGFHDEESGRVNAEAALVLLGGFTRREASRRVAEIRSFAEIGEYFDLPIKTYSTGMRLRLGFATATMLEPEVLVTDEVLAVGDEAFQRKCSRYFDRFLAAGGSLVLCSHDLSQIDRLCERTLWLDGGIVAGLGASKEVIREYRRSIAGAVAGDEAEANGAAASEDGDARGGAGATHASGELAGLPYEVTALRLLDERGAPIETLETGQTVVVEAEVLAHAGVPHVVIGITRDDLTPVYGVSSDMDGAAPAPLGGGRHLFRLTFPALPLTAGRHRLRAHALDETATRLYDTVEIHFTVAGDARERGLLRVATEWLE